MLLASVEPKSDMGPMASALRTKDADELTRDYVATTLIDEYNSRNQHRGQPSRSSNHRHILSRKRSADAILLKTGSAAQMIPAILTSPLVPSLPLWETSEKDVRINIMMFAIFATVRATARAIDI